jgi:hypothetical protein
MPVAVAALHIRDAFGQGDDLAAGADGHVAVGERHRGGRGLILEVGQLRGQAARLEELSKRSAREVLDDHLKIANRLGPDDDLERIVQDDLDRNIAKVCVILMNRGTFHGHEGVVQLAQMLGEELPEHRGFQYTYTAVEGRMAFLEWAYEDAQVKVTDGADSYLIEDGKIVAQTIHYTVQHKQQAS